MEVAPPRAWPWDLELNDALDLGAGRLVDVDFFVLVVGRAGRDDPDEDFDIVFSLE